MRFETTVAGIEPRADGIHVTLHDGYLGDGVAAGTVRRAVAW